MARRVRRFAVLASAGGCYAIRRSCEELRPASGASATSSLSDARGAMDTAGFAIVDGVVSTAALQRCKETEAFRSMPRTAAVTDLPHRDRLWRPSAFGRFHRVSFADEDRQAYEQLEKSFAPLVEASAADSSCSASQPR